jgi:hypothetical protein
MKSDTSTVRVPPLKAKQITLRMPKHFHSALTAYCERRMIPVSLFLLDLAATKIKYEPPNTPAYEARATVSNTLFPTLKPVENPPGIGGDWMEDDGE